MINWKVRIKQKWFWVAIIPAVLLLIQLVLDVVGVKVDFGVLGEKLLAIVDAVFVILAIIGVVTDPTTEGLHDSALAMAYEFPKTKDGVYMKEESDE